MYQDIIEIEQPLDFYDLPKRVGVDGYNGLEGLNIGKFFSRAFHWKGIVRKAPRILAGATSALVMGGHGGSFTKGALTAAAGGVVAAIPKRKKGTSFLKDVGIGLGMGAIPGTAIGAYRGLTKPYGTSVQEIGLAGKGTQYLQKRFFPNTLKQYKTIGPAKPPVSKVNVARAGGTPTGTILKEAARDSVQSSVASPWWETGVQLVKATAPLATMVAAQGMMSSQNGQYGFVDSATQGGYMDQPGQEQFYMPEGQYGQPPIYGQDSMFGVPGDIGMASPGGGGFMPITDPQTGETVWVPQPSFWERYKMPITIGAVTLLGGTVLYRVLKR